MESIGQKLLSAREALGFSIEQIARETNIAKSYLTALEAEDFDSFPGETYLLGFLRNYSEYLGLDPGDMIILYRNMKIQEQPAPIEELLDKRGSMPKAVLVVIIIIAILGIGAAGYFYLYPNFIEGRIPAEVKSAGADEDKPVTETKINIRNTYEFADEVLEKRFNKHDAISVLLNGGNFQLIIADITEEVTFIYPQGELVMKSGEETLLDLDGDSSADIRILLRNVDAEQGSLVVHVDRFVQTSASMEPGLSSADSASAGASSTVAEGAETVLSGQAGAPSRVVDTVVIRDASSPESFTLNIIFRGYCLFRYDADSSPREERYFHKGETLRLDVNSEVMLWASNAGAISAKVNGVDITLGGSGEITTRNIKWFYNSTSSKYELQLTPVY